ncbi:hypothetical protein D5086_002824 [Populus alba]|uniref:Uncharacterized protein n=1 Tax=Populus alba TaxID=43335 RepID=A0ACC4D358_POPAL
MAKSKNKSLIIRYVQGNFKLEVSHQASTLCMLKAQSRSQSPVQQDPLSPSHASTLPRTKVVFADFVGVFLFYVLLEPPFTGNASLFGSPRCAAINTPQGASSKHKNRPHEAPTYSSNSIPSTETAAVKKQQPYSVVPPIDPPFDHMFIEAITADKPRPSSPEPPKRQYFTRSRVAATRRNNLGQPEKQKSKAPAAAGHRIQSSSNDSALISSL